MALALTSVGLASCGVASSTSPRSLPVSSAIFAPRTLQVDVRTASPRAPMGTVVPRGRYWGVIRGAIVTCGEAGVSLSPTQMSRRPVEVELWYRHREVASERLARRSGFVFVVVGNRRPPVRPLWRLPLRRVHVVTAARSPWSPTLVLTTSSGFRAAIAFGGLDDMLGESLQIPQASCTR